MHVQPNVNGLVDTLAITGEIIHFVPLHFGNYRTLIDSLNYGDALQIVTSCSHVYKHLRVSPMRVYPIAQTLYTLFLYWHIMDLTNASRRH